VRIGAFERWGVSAHQGRKPMAMSLAEAAAATGVNRSTLFRAYKSGRMSATRADTGQIEVDPSELFRVFPPVAPQQGAQGETHQLAQAAGAHDNTLKIGALTIEIKMLREMLDTMREDRDAWRDQAGKVTAVLACACPNSREASRLVASIGGLVEGRIGDASKFAKYARATGTP
jgi:hypothetical protein